MLDADTLDDIETIPLPHAPGTLALDERTGLLWIGDAIGGTLGLMVLDLSLPANHPDRLRNAGGCSWSVGVDPRTSYVYAACIGQLNVVDGDPGRPTFLSLVAQIPTFPGLASGDWARKQFAVSTRRNEIYVPTGAEQSVLVIDGDPAMGRSTRLLRDSMPRASPVFRAIPIPPTTRCSFGRPV